MKAGQVDSAIIERLLDLLKQFKLPAVASEIEARFSEAGHRESLLILVELLEQEASERKRRRVERLLVSSHLPPGKTLETFDDQRLPRPLTAQLRRLCDGLFLDNAMNVLMFGLPGTGKSHAACALGRALVNLGRKVLFIPTYEVVQQLLIAKRDLEMTNALRKLDAYELLILDDFGYVQQSAEEVEVLFTLLGERYERRSILITSNLVFSEWERIFKNPMTTLAAIDRTVHNSDILEFAVPSFRKEQAQKRKTQAEEVTLTDSTH